MGLAHTPYDGSKQPFTIGLEPLASRAWLEIDDRCAGDLAEKKRLFAEALHEVFLEEAASRPAQREAADAIRAFLAAQQLPCRLSEDEPPLLAISRLVQEDLCLLQRDETGWRLTAASLCFPSAWSLREKFGLPMAAIHADVPGFPGRMAEIVARIFDNLKVEQPVVRWNWSIYGDDRLRHPETHVDPAERFPQDIPMSDQAVIRVERQTLRRLPETGAIVFTIRVHLSPMRVLERHPRGPDLAWSLRAQLLALTSEQLDYKGLTDVRERLAAALAVMAGG